MGRKRITERFPWLLPLRQAQRKFCFYWEMAKDPHHYGVTQASQLLAYELFHTRSLLVNLDSGYPIEYQYNKVHNLKLAAKKIHGLIINPGETFSFCLAIKDADKHQLYRDGLSLVNGEIKGEYGGGLCQFSNVLYWAFLHTELTIVERHGHGVEAIPPTDPNALVGVDATVAEGWLDLKVKNETKRIYQLAVSFDEKSMLVTIRSNEKEDFVYEVYNGEVVYRKEKGDIVEHSTVMRRQLTLDGTTNKETKLYENTCLIEYPLPADTNII
ncbi:vancomycin resistance protein VanW [Clostridiales Family XIII bacterium PM5-7]